ncbi:MAG: hypothetical protein GY850_23750 [bacterium]|nr:hypothetical protein [bacterium]
MENKVLVCFLVFMLNMIPNACKAENRIVSPMIKNRIVPIICFTPEEAQAFDDELVWQDKQFNTFLSFPNEPGDVAIGKNYNHYIDIRISDLSIPVYLSILSDDELRAIETGDRFRILRGRLQGDSICSLKLPLVSEANGEDMNLMNTMFTVEDDYVVLHNQGLEKDFYVKNFDYVKIRGLPMLEVPAVAEGGRQVK